MINRRAHYELNRVFFSCALSAECFQLPSFSQQFAFALSEQNRKEHIWNRSESEWNEVVGCVHGGTVFSSIIDIVR